MTQITSVVNVPTDELVLRTELNSTDIGKGASQIGIEDDGGYYAGDTVEEALQELPKGTVVYDKIQFNKTSIVQHSEGSIHRDDNDKTIEIDTDIDGVHIQVGQENVVRVVNKTGSQINNGKVVYISGAQGNRPKIDLADCDSGVTANSVIGVTTCDIDNNHNGYVTTQGLVRGVDTSSYSEGDKLYLSSTSGEFTKTKPTVPCYVIQIGYVVVANADGVILVNIDREWTRFGDDNNYSHFESDGTLEMVGDATTWEDLNASALEIKVQGTGVSINTTENTLDFTSASDLNDYGFSNFQMRHAWKIGSNIFPHIHREQAENNVPNWLIQYRRQMQGEGKTTAWSNYVCNTSAFTYTSGTLNQICYDSTGITPPANAGLSDVIEFRIYRDNANTSGLFAGTNTYTATARITFVDIHIQEDTLGSRQEYIK